MGCCARILAFCDNADLCFVGRSPENFFDHLSGLLIDSSWSQRVQLLQFSWRWVDEDRISSHALVALRNYFETIGLDPWYLARRTHPVAFVDLVYTGETLGRLVSFLYQWARQLGVDWQGVKRKIRLVGITTRTQAGPDTWRWQQHAEWVTLLQRRAIKNVSISEQMWCYLGEEQAKVTVRYSHRRWGTREVALPRYDAKRLEALRLAAWLFNLGRDKEWRREFARHLSKERAMIHPWFRRLVLELKGLRSPGSLTAAISLIGSGSSEGRMNLACLFFSLKLFSDHVCYDSVYIDYGGNIMQETHYSLSPLGFLQSPLKERGEAPNQGHEGAPDAWLEVHSTVAEGLEGIAVGDEIIVITWLHKAQRDILKTHPRNDETMPLAGVFATRSPDRPNPLGLHRVTVREIAGKRVKVGPIEAIDGTPVIDIKPVLSQSADS